MEAPVLLKTIPDIPCECVPITEEEMMDALIAHCEESWKQMNELLAE